MIDRPIAFLVDGDNVSLALIPEMLTEVAKYGKATIRRAYSDWTTPQMSKWKSNLLEYSVIPMQQFSNVSGKNATDSTMIIDAMDILHKGEVMGFCIVSSDSDYTRLASRIREANLFVMGIGETKTPSSFRQACEIFVTTDNLHVPKETKKGSKVAKGTAQPKIRIPPEALEILEKAFDLSMMDNGSAYMSKLGIVIRRLDSGFDARTYGYPRLLDLVQALPEKFETEYLREDESGPILLRRKPKE